MFNFSCTQLTLSWGGQSNAPAQQANCCNDTFPGFGNTNPLNSMMNTGCGNNNPMGNFMQFLGMLFMAMFMGNMGAMGNNNWLNALQNLFNPNRQGCGKSGGGCGGSGGSNNACSQPDSPPALDEPGEAFLGAAPKPGQATFKASRNSGYFKSGQIALTDRDGKVHYFQATSGGHGRGALPAGTYTISNPRRRNTAGMVKDGVGYSFDLSNKYDSRVGDTRTELRIHPDGGSPGTRGCIGIVGNAATQEKFYALLKDNIARNGGRYQITVE